MILLSAQIGITKFVGGLHAPFTSCLSCAFDFDWINENALTGDIILCRTNAEVSNLFIDGFFTHAALLIRTGNGLFIYEAVGEGVIKTRLFDYLKKHDFCVVLRAKFPIMPAGISAVAEEVIGYPYDFLFGTEYKEFYCSEYVDYVYNKACGISFKRKKSFGRNIIYPYHIVEDTRFETVYKSKSLCQ